MYRALFNGLLMAGFAGMVAILAFSCREECRYKPKSLAMIDFHSVNNGTDNKSPVSNFTAYGIGREDSLLYNGVSSISSIRIPMNGNSAETGFVFLADGQVDTVWFTYRVIPWFLSQECGFVLNFDLTGARHTSNLIDSVVIVTSEVTSFDDTNVRIYH